MKLLNNSRMLFKGAPDFATIEPADKKVRFAKTRKNHRIAQTPEPEKPVMTAEELLWESYKSAVATITHLTKSSVY